MDVLTALHCDLSDKKAKQGLGLRGLIGELLNLASGGKYRSPRKLRLVPGVQF